MIDSVRQCVLSKFPTLTLLSQVPLKIGEVFVHFEQDDTAPYLDQLVEKMEKQVRQLEAEASSTKEKMNGLKGRLYAKFGNSINLEADDSK